MKSLGDNKTRKYPSKPEWQIILDHMVYQDHIMLYRICRRMIIHLDRCKVKEVYKIIEELNPTEENRSNIQNFGPNWPKPKGVPFRADVIIDKVFAIADNYLQDDEITKILRQWIHQEHLSFFSKLLEHKHAPLSEVTEAVSKYLKLFKRVQSEDEIVGLRVSLIARFLSENLAFINIAKNYITIKVMAEVLDRAIGPALGNGKLGGKSAGLILARQILIYKKKVNPYLENVYTPKSRFLTSDTLIEFIHYNALEEFIYTKYQSLDEIKHDFSFLEYIFKNSHFPPESINAFNMILDVFEGRPIIIRSSSLLEDSFEASFAGKYKSLFLSNLGTKQERMAALVNAIAEVYACTFGPDPIEYRKEKGLIDFREEMGILIQEVVGTKIGKYFLPAFAGVAFSNNEMRWSTRIDRQDGVIRIVAGLGTRAVDRTIDDYPILISPGKPSIKVNHTVEQTIKYSQQYVDFINLETNKFETLSFVELIKECNGNYPMIDKIVSFNRNGFITEPISIMADFLKEDLIVTFNGLVEKTEIIKQIKAILDELSRAFNGPVDIEFAYARDRLYLLQCRPQSKIGQNSAVKIPLNIIEESIIFTADQFVSNGVVKEIQYLVYVSSTAYASLSSIEEMNQTGAIVSKLNRKLPKKKFILIGPGRWGSRGDIKLGVPVIYSDINNTAMLIEVAKEKEGFVPELSFGTHFFQDLVEADIKYLPLYPDNQDIVFREEFLMESENMLSKFVPDSENFENVVRVIDVKRVNGESSLSVFMDGESNKAVAYIEGI